MPALVSIRDLTIQFRGPPLLDNVSCQIEPGQRIGLLGRNGAGKTTLMRVIAGLLEADAGLVQLEPGTKVAWLPQDVPRDIHGTIRDVVAAGFPEWMLQSDQQDWQRQNATDQILSRMELDGDGEFSQLSSGMKRRVLLARALVIGPDLLLLDEPTNHLDINAIEWLEEFLQKFSAAIMFVTHDRTFLKRIASRILEIDRGRIFDWSCNYETFLNRKEMALAAEEKQNELFDKKLAEEEVWIRTGVKARRTRNEGRVRALEQLRLQRAERRNKTGTSNLQIQEGQRSGNLVIEADEIDFSYSGRPIVSGFSTSIMRGDKIGIIGPNGVGKTTLLKILLGKLPPDSGKIRLGTNLQIAYFDQMREQLDEFQTVAHNVSDGYDHIEINGNRRHVLGYLQDFLFTPDRARTEVRFLSGGERNRILLAKLFSKAANLIVLDEPTNDLDAETLEMLEDRLVAFNGTILLVSHDRTFLNNVVTSSIVFENGQVKEYDGGYDDWLRQRRQPTNGKTSFGPNATQSTNAATESPRKLRFKEKLELEQLPKTIEVLEAEIAQLHVTIADPKFYQQSGELIADGLARLKQLEQSVSEAYRRWDELENVRA